MGKAWMLIIRRKQQRVLKTRNVCWRDHQKRLRTNSNWSRETRNALRKTETDSAEEVFVLFRPALFLFASQMNTDDLNQALSARKRYIDSVSSFSASGISAPSSTSIASSSSAKSSASAPLSLSTTTIPFFTADLHDKSPSGFVGLSNQGATCYLVRFL